MADTKPREPNHMTTQKAPELADVKSDSWCAQQPATLLFVVRDGRILLIRKKRGLGAGKINGPGGRIEPGETPLQAAVRETQEELCVTPVDPVHLGQLRFQFLDGLSLDVAIFRSPDCEGEATETDEAIPLWVGVDDIPYDQMWPDDEHWLPLMLAGQTFRGYFLFDDSAMLDFELHQGVLLPAG